MRQTFEQTQDIRPPMPTIITATGAHLTIGDETRRLRPVPTSETTATDLGFTEVVEVWIDHAQGNDLLGLVSRSLYPAFAVEFDIAMREYRDGEYITLAKVCADAAKAQAQ